MGDEERPRRRAGARPTDAAWTAAFKTGAWLARRAPERVLAAAAAPLGDAFRVAMRGRRSTLERHLRRVIGPEVSEAQIRSLSRAAFASYARYWVESFRLPNLPPDVVAAGLRVQGYEHVEAGLAEGNGVILALPHLGGWEWAGRWVADRGLPITVVVEPLRPASLFEWFVDLRRSLGMTVVPLGPDVGNACLKALKSNEVLCLLCDRQLGPGGIEVDFFGERTRLPAGPATLALRTGAALLPVAVYFDEQDGHLGVVRPPLAVERTARLREDASRLTQALADELADLIRRAPEQWHLFQPNWPSDPGYEA